MTLEDLPAVMEVDGRCMSAPWSAGVWRGELASPLGLHLVAEIEGRVVAQIGTKRVLDELHVTTLAVLPEHRRHGLGRALLQAALERTEGARRVVLEVRSRNEGAILFYRSLGFAAVGTRPRYYGDDDALVMSLDVPPQEERF